MKQETLSREQGLDTLLVIAYQTLFLSTSYIHSSTITGHSEDPKLFKKILHFKKVGA